MAKKGSILTLFCSDWRKQRTNLDEIFEVLINIELREVRNRRVQSFIHLALHKPLGRLIIFNVSTFALHRSKARKQ
jgi:hypothetical protein